MATKKALEKAKKLNDKAKIYSSVYRKTISPPNHIDRPIHRQHCHFLKFTWGFISEEQLPDRRAPLNRDVFSAPFAFIGQGGILIKMAYFGELFLADEGLQKL